MKTKKDFEDAKQRAEAAEHRGQPDKNWSRVQQIGVAGIALGAMVALISSFSTSGKVGQNAANIGNVSQQVSQLDSRMAEIQKCRDARRAYYVGAERTWFFAIDQAEHMDVLSKKRFAIRVKAFDDREKSFDVYDNWKCPDPTTGTPVPKPS